MIRALWPHLRRRFAADQHGTTLVEAMVVILIISIIGLVTVSITVSLFNSNIRAGQYLNQQTTIEQFYGFMSSRLSVSQRGEIGLTSCRPASGGTIITNPTQQQLEDFCTTNPSPDSNASNNGAYDTEAGAVNPNAGNKRIYPECATENTSCKTVVNPLTVSGDQVMFRSGGLCYRVFYLNEDLKAGSTVIKQGDSLNAAVSGDCAEIWPNRGANQTTAQQAPGSANYDAVLDAADGSFPLAYGIQSEKPDGVTGTVAVPATDPLVPLAYLDSGDQRYATTDFPTNAPGTPAAFYVPQNGQTAAEILNQIYSLSATAYVSAPGINDDSSIRINDRYYEQSFFLNQLCDINGNYLGTNPPTGDAGGDLDGQYPDPEIRANAVGSNEIAGDSVTSAKIPNDAVGSSEIGANAVGSSEIGILPAAKITPGAAQSIANQSWVTLAINSANSEIFDVGTSSEQFTTTNGSRINIRESGVYLISARVMFTSSNAGIRGVSVIKNGASAGILGETSSAATNVLGSTQSASVTGAVKLNAGDYVQLQGYQSSGAALNTIAGDPNTYLSAVWIGKG